MDAPSRTEPELTLLGEFQLHFAGEPVALSGPGRRLVAYLAVVHRHRPVRRLALAERLWCDSPPDRAAASLRSVLWRLPRPRGRTLVSGGAATVRLRDGMRVDLWRGEERARVLCADDAPSAAELGDLGDLQADLLPGWEDDWLSVEREAFRQKRLHALERSAVALRERGRFTDALAAGLGAVRSEPLRESAHRRVIEVHLAEGNASEALRHYDSYRHLLATELGLAPSPRLRRIVGPYLGRPDDT